MFIDTCFYIDLMREHCRKTAGPAKRKLLELEFASINVPVFVLCELYAGAKGADNPHVELRKIEMFLENTEVIYPNESFAMFYGETEYLIRKRGHSVYAMDLLIGVLAKSYGQPVLTRNIKDFQKIPDLIVETY